MMSTCLSSFLRHYKIIQNNIIPTTNDILNMNFNCNFDFFVCDASHILLWGKKEKNMRPHLEKQNAHCLVEEHAFCFLKHPPLGEDKITIYNMTSKYTKKNNNSNMFFTMLHHWQESWENISKKNCPPNYKLNLNMVRLSPPQKLFSQKVDKYFLWKEEFVTKYFHFTFFFGWPRSMIFRNEFWHCWGQKKNWEVWKFFFFFFFLGCKFG